MVSIPIHPIKFFELICNYKNSIYKREREIHVGRSITLPAIGLFITGCAFSYAAVIPFILDFLYRYGESAGLVTFLNIMDFVSGIPGFASNIFGIILAGTRVVVF